MEWWLEGKDELVLKAMHPKSWMAMKGDLAKFSSKQREVRGKMKGMKMVRLQARNDAIVQRDQPKEFQALELTLTELFGTTPEEALGGNWLFARIAIFDAKFSDSKRSIKVRLFAVKEGNRWLLVNLPM